MKPNIATANGLTRGQESESAVLIKIAEQLELENIQMAVEMFLRGTVEIVNKKIIDILGTIKTSATKEKFIAKDKFTTSSKEVKFHGFGNNFISWFLAGNGKIEEPIDEQELRYGNLTKNSVDFLIIQELGGGVEAETTLTELYDLLKKQANGKEGTLYTNGRTNTFYIRDVNGIRSPVYVHLCDGGWYIDADFAGSPDALAAGSRIFSRNS